MRRYKQYTSVGAMVFVLLLTLATIQVASASLWLDFEPSSGPPGRTITARTGGEGAFASHLRNQSYDIYLVSSEAAEAISSPNDTRLVEVGKLEVGADGNGELRFVVPELSPGEYIGIIYCEPCAVSSAGRILLPVGQFQITTPNDETPLSELSKSIKQPIIIFASLLILLMVVALSLKFRWWQRE